MGSGASFSIDTHDPLFYHLILPSGKEIFTIQDSGKKTMNDEGRDREHSEEKYEELKESLYELEERYQSLIETNLYGIQEIDIYGNITFMNSVQYEILGYREGELRGSQIWDLLASDDDRNELTEYLTKIALGEYAPFPWIGKYIRQNGETIRLKIDWRCRQSSSSDTVTGFVSVISDVVDREFSMSRFQVEEEEAEDVGDLRLDPEAETLAKELSMLSYPGVDALADDIGGIVGKELQGIHQQLEQIRQEFQSKLKYDAHKDKLIDNLHRELQDHKGDILKKYLRSIVMDIIQLIDNTRKLAGHYKTRKLSEKDSPKLLRLLEDIPSDMEDIFYRQGINTYTCKEKTFDATRQKILKTVETSDISKDKTVAASIRPGYEWDGQIIRPEMVAVYVFKEA